MPENYQMKGRYCSRFNSQNKKSYTNPIILETKKYGILKYDNSKKKRKNKSNRYNLELNNTEIKKHHLLSLNNSSMREPMGNFEGIPDIRSSAKFVIEVIIHSKSPKTLEI